MTGGKDDSVAPRLLAIIRCARCNAEAERVAVRADKGVLHFIVDCHGERQILELDESALDGKKITGGEAFGDNPGIALNPFGAGYGV